MKIFNVRATRTIDSGNFRIYDCDKFTRNYCEEKLGISVCEPIEVPVDSYQQYRMSLQPGADDVWGKFHSKKNANKTYVEARLGHNANNEGREGFIRFGNQALRFRCIWDNTHNLYGDLLEFSMMYYLADDTVEIVSSPSTIAKEKVQNRIYIYIQFCFHHITIFVHGNDR